MNTTEWNEMPTDAKLDWLAVQAEAQGMTPAEAAARLELDWEAENA